MDHWPLHARHWALIGPPLRPCPDDVRIALEIATAWAQAHDRPPRALLLGVTPELATMAWPAGTTLIAIDRARAMIGALFPAGPAREAMVGDWLALPRADASVDVALGDGCLSNLAFPGDYPRFAAELARVLVDDGVLALRLFASPARRESLAEVARAAHAGAIASFHAFKWRLAMAVTPDDGNVRVSDILRAFEDVVPDRAALADATGWPRPVIDHIDAYRGSALVYSFPTADAAAAALGGTLIEVDRRVPGYELGERCPTLILRRR